MPEETERIEKLIKAGKIAADVREASRELIKPGTSLLEISERVEKMIIDKGGGIAFPLNLSLNDIAAHYTPVKNDTIIIQEGDVLKVDMGVHVDGFIADTAYTACFNAEYDKMVESTEKALQAAIDLIKPGVKINQLSQAIEETIRSFGFTPVSNLTGHGIGQYVIHTRPTIPNVATGTGGTLEDGMSIAIEPFATNGAGIVKESEPAVILGMNRRAPVRNQDARIIMNFAEDRNGLPFAERWLPIDSIFKTRIALRELRSRGVIYDYPPLKEIRGGVVAQTEHTVIVRDEPIVTTK